MAPQDILAEEEGSVARLPLKQDFDPVFSSCGDIACFGESPELINKFPVFYGWETWDSFEFTKIAGCNLNVSHEAGCVNLHA